MELIYEYRNIYEYMNIMWIFIYSYEYNTEYCEYYITVYR